MGETASFGFHYGLNWGVPVPCMPNQPIGMQLGYRGVSSNYSGASFTEDSRDQSFITAGLFRRVDWGLQGGVVVDILSDKWYYDDLSLTQLRGELSWVFPQCHELGAFFTAGTKTNEVASTMWVNDQQQTTVIEEYEPTDLIAFFYRRRFEAVGGGYGRLVRRIHRRWWRAAGRGLQFAADRELGAEDRLHLPDSQGRQQPRGVPG